MASDSVVSMQPCMDRMDAARTLLDVSPVLTASSASLGPSTIPSLSLGASVVASSTSTSSRSNRGGLDALAALASKEVGNARSVSSDDDSEAMPPPPPRRMRSLSNPEGMEKWDSMNPRRVKERRHFVLPTCILEEELAEASAAAEAAKLEEEENARMEEEDVYRSSDGPFGTSPNCVSSPISSMDHEEEEESESPTSDESDLEPDELLQRARSRLLEDLSEGSLSGEKGVLTLPHSLSKYKEVYNKNGRIGIYTPAERAAIIARFNGKRSRRVWNKKIRYSCRKNLADRRLRVKGRFVKRTKKDDMPDVNDPEAGFSPTKDQPYRRHRRHTIT